MKSYYAHKKHTRKHLLTTHLTNTAKRTSAFASKFGAEDLGYPLGLYHDVGKYIPDFQARLDGDPVQVDHATAGAQLLNEHWGFIGKLLAYAIAGHHTGLMDYGPETVSGTLGARLSKQLGDYSAYKGELLEPQQVPQLPSSLNTDDVAFTLALYTKILYSCLIDADWLDTEGFMQGTLREEYPKVHQLKPLLDRYLDNLDKPTTHLNRLRAEIQGHCLDKAEGQRGTYVLSAPTGSGKTLSSMVFALNHAKKHNLDRIIYVIPYISITEQTSETFKRIFGDDYVLEHHSSFDLGREEHRLAAENWDIPIVVTTNVQFFESLYKADKGRNRKLHNIVNSVVIFDEVQMFPIEYLKPCLRAVDTLVTHFGVTSLFCSATPPDFQKYYTTPIIEILPDPEKYNQDFRRISITDIGNLPLSSLTTRLSKHNQVLSVVNTKKLAKKLYESLPTSQNNYHLSTNMCPKHRSEVIASIKAVLGTNLPCKVVSTQLIEAGVNIDFPDVYREHAGLDSVIQAGGRCNREWKVLIGHLYIFGIHDIKCTWPMSIYRAYGVYKELVRTHPDMQVVSVVREYFDKLYKYEGDKTLDKKEILADLTKLLEYKYKTVSDKFNLIEDTGVPVLIPYNREAERLISALKQSKVTRQILRKLQQYTVSVYPEEHSSLKAKGKIELVEDIWILKDFETNYSKYTGIDLGY